MLVPAWFTVFTPVLCNIIVNIFHRHSLEALDKYVEAFVLMVSRWLLSSHIVRAGLIVKHLIKVDHILKLQLLQRQVCPYTTIIINLNLRCQVNHTVEAIRPPSLHMIFVAAAVFFDSWHRAFDFLFAHNECSWLSVEVNPVQFLPILLHKLLCIQLLPQVWANCIVLALESELTILVDGRGVYLHQWLMIRNLQKLCFHLERLY